MEQLPVDTAIELAVDHAIELAEAEGLSPGEIEDHLRRLIRKRMPNVLGNVRREKVKTVLVRRDREGDSGHPLKEEFE